MLYDDRGRAHEQRVYDVSDPNGNTYRFTRTYRDDLDRVTAEPSDLFYYEGDRLVWQRVAASSGGSGGGGGGECPPEGCSPEDPAPPPINELKTIVREDDASAESAVDFDSKFAARASTTITYHTHREFVWGLDYIDELIAQISPPTTTGGPEVLHYVLQDANYDLIALIADDGAMKYQYRYHPYGKSTGYENKDGLSSPPLPVECDVFDLDDDGDLDLSDLGDLPFGAQGNRAYTTIPLIWEGAQPAIIRYDAD